LRLDGLPDRLCRFDDISQLIGEASDDAGGDALHGRLHVRVGKRTPPHDFSFKRIAALAGLGLQPLEATRAIASSSVLGPLACVPLRGFSSRTIKPPRARLSKRAVALSRYAALYVARPMKKIFGRGMAEPKDRLAVRAFERSAQELP
jgi:hypothetical protein